MIVTCDESTWNSPSMGLVLAAVSTLKNLLVLASRLSWPLSASVTRPRMMGTRLEVASTAARPRVQAGYSTR